jgi:hypothetical protein
MSETQELIRESHKVGVKLMGGGEAEVVAAVVADAHPEAEIEHYPSYISIKVPDRLVIDLPRISEQLGRPYDAPMFLVILSSYHGRIDVEDEQVTLTTDI